jgi:hypothetical protein
MSKHAYRVNGKFAKKPQTQADRLENHFCLVVDRSGSMNGLQQQVIKFVNRWLDDIRDMSNRFGQTSYVNLIIYDDVIDVVFANVEANKAPEFTNYRPRNMTALFEAEEKGIDLLIQNTSGKTGNISYVVNHITDGQENASWGGRKILKINELTSRMVQLQNQGNWTFTFLLPPGDKSSFVNSYRLEAGNIPEWETTEQGIYEAEEKTSGGIFSYGAARSIGVSSVRNFYDVKVDLSNVKNLSQVAKQNGLTNLVGKYNCYDVIHEDEIRHYVEVVLNKNYNKGECFYQLTKEEKVQPTKDVLVMEKGKSAIYGGSEARHLIGLPDGQYAKVDPYNLSNLNIFIQSTSVNRKLVRGTKILIKR